MGSIRIFIHSEVRNKASLALIKGLAFYSRNMLASMILNINLKEKVDLIILMIAVLLHWDISEMIESYFPWFNILSEKLNPSQGEYKKIDTDNEII